MRIKALSSTVDSQSSRITDLMSAKAMADLEGGKEEKEFCTSLNYLQLYCL